ncbi:MAG: extracellular solute-binding protein [Clostridia bacterium]|nr:extracellular solute-binding protein [Clostridia bacterium]MBQ8511760.1 extracellular solute-binding protein [Clostridia bacterium]
MKKTLCLFLALLMASSALISCSESTENAGESQDTAASAVDPNAGETEAVETERMYANIPADANFDGHTFTIFCSSNSEYSIIQNDFAAEEITGEAINDARYNRNILVGDTLNVKITSVDCDKVGHGNGYTYISQDVQGGTGAYDIATACGYDTTKLAQSNFLMDIKTVPYIDLAAPWWDQVAEQDMSILGQLFFTTGEITTSDNDATYCVMFNKQMIEDYGMENPYELVDNSKWTMDKFIDMASQVTEDTDGNGQYTDADKYGAMVWDDTMMGVVNCSGAKCVTVNSEGLLELTLNTETVVDSVTKFLDFAAQKQNCFAYQRHNWTDALLVNMFSGDQSLFLTQLIQIVPKMRDMDTDFGILPIFKYTETQDKYYTTMGSWHSVFVCVPNGQKNVERTGIITEMLACEGMYDLTEAYYEKTLVGKTTRDEESRAMLDIIFSSRVYDLGWFFQIGSYNESVMNLFRQDNNNFASMYKQASKASERSLQKNNEAFQEAKEELEAQMAAQ